MAPYAWVFVGGGLGAVARYALGQWIVTRADLSAGTGFPLHTLLINVTGSLAIGVLVVLFQERSGLDPALRLFFVVGLLGGYTTFSAFSAETIALLERGDWPRAALYVAASNLLSLAACGAGVILGRRVWLY